MLSRIQTVGTLWFGNHRPCLGYHFLTALKKETGMKCTKAEIARNQVTCGELIFFSSFW